MNKKKSIAVAIVLVAVLLIGGLLAYFTDTDTATNTFTIGNVNITLTEPSWVTTDSNNNNIPDAAEARIPGQVIAKDPTVTVETGSSDAFIFVTVDVPAIITGAEGNYTAGKEMVTYTLNSGWVEVTSKKVIDADSVKHVYVYGTASAPTAVSAGSANAVTLFDEVTINSLLTNAEVTSNFTGAKDVVVNAYGIQADGLSVTTPEDIFELF